MPKRRTCRVLVTLSYAARDDYGRPITAAMARRELRTRVNELCCYSLEEADVRVRAAKPEARYA